jgi:hypothetical protein
MEIIFNGAQNTTALTFPNYVSEFPEPLFWKKKLHDGKIQRLLEQMFPALKGRKHKTLDGLKNINTRWEQ